MVEELQTTLGFEMVSEEIESWETITMNEVRLGQTQQKFGTSYGVGRKVINGKIVYSAKLPVSSGLTSKTIKLGTFETLQDATDAVQYALEHPTISFEFHSSIQGNLDNKSSLNVANHTPLYQSEILEPSYCELIIPKKREWKDKIIRKEKALLKKEKQKQLQLGPKETFIASIESYFHKELYKIKSENKFLKLCNKFILQLLQNVFPYKGSNINIRQNKNGAYDFCYEVLNLLWNNKNHNDNSPFVVTSVEEFIQQTDDISKYGDWIEQNIYKKSMQIQQQ